MAQLGRPVRAFFADVTTATARVQAPEECGVVAQAGQGCCGTLMLPVGLEQEAAAMARRLIHPAARDRAVGGETGLLVGPPRNQNRSRDARA